MLSTVRRAAVVASALLGLGGVPAAADPPASLPAVGTAPGSLVDLPPLPEGVTALQFGEVFLKPVGPRGLVFTDKVKSLDGRRVRILGHMVRREGAPPGTLLLTPYPVQLHDSEYGLADDLPPNTLLVTVPDAEGEIPFTAGLLLLTGRLEIGSREEPDGRTSVVRLVLDPKTQGQGATPGPKAVNP